MGQQRLVQAIEMFQRARALDPRLDTAELNLGIALMNQRQVDAARQVLQRYASEHATDPRVWYNLGLLNKNSGSLEAALDDFKRAQQLAPSDPDALYFLGATLAQTGDFRGAVAAFQKALALNRFHASAEFGLARAYQRLDDVAAAGEHLARFQELTRTKLGAPITVAYGDQGPLSLGQQAHGSEPEVSPPINVSFVSATVPAGLAESEAATATGSGAACFFDYDGDGLPDLYAGTGKLFRNTGGKFELVRNAQLPASSACAAADFDNDGHTDLALVHGNDILLYRNKGNGVFEDVTSSSGLKGAAGMVSLIWLDFDHDGDVDLFVTGQGAGGTGGGNVLWRNNGNGTFTNWTAETALNGTSSESTSALPFDFNADRAIDLLVTGATTQLLLNPREGKWSASQQLPGGSTAGAILDFDNDGVMDVALTFSTAPALRLFRNQSGKTLEPVTLPELPWARAWGVAAVDYDNDGRTDLVAAGETRDGRYEVRLLRNEGPHGFRDVSAEVGLNKLSLREPRQIVPVDYDNDGDTDLLITARDGSIVLLRNDGGNQNHALRLALKGLNDNKSAIGTLVEVYAGNLYQKVEVSGAGYLGQSSTDLLIGLGKRERADVVRLLWPTGVVQDEIELSAGTPHRVTEIDRRGSSCPILFAWDGARYRFVADMLGAGVVGHWIAPGERNIPDPTEYLKIDGFQPQPRGGRLSFRLMEPMEEVVYVDQVRLLAIDHPRAVDVYPNEYFASNPPFPAFRVVTSESATHVRAWDDSGNEVTSLLRDRDRRYLADFQLLPFKGFTAPHQLELDLGQPYDGGPLSLLMHGYIEYFTATSMFAASQAGLAPIAPYVEAEVAPGRWIRILDDMGFPAGLPRTITVDLSGKLPKGARRLRITTNLQIYWDQILADRKLQTPVRTIEVPLSDARLRFHGYPRATEGPSPGDVRYIYEQVSRTGPYAREVGAYTRFGEVRDLLSRVDDRFVVFGSGEELALEFDPTHLPALPSGWARDFFFFADGYEKDMDFYAAEPLTVAPLPFHAMSGYPPRSAFPTDKEHLVYQLRFNNRFIGGTEPPSYRFEYPRAVPPATHE